jgi:hypothetical protein
MAAESDCTPFRLGHELRTDTGASQFAVHPQQIDKQPARIKMADQPGLNLTYVTAQENAKIIVSVIGQKRRVVVAEPFVDELAGLLGRVFFDAEAAAAR